MRCRGHAASNIVHFEEKKTPNTAFNTICVLLWPKIGGSPTGGGIVLPPTCEARTSEQIMGSTLLRSSYEKLAFECHFWALWQLRRISNRTEIEIAGSGQIAVARDVT